ncbi:MAG: hypothetical protein A2568_03660 [Candidatus Yanofskybacteria bacterium RIFOXYD1_FULL_44_17]|nr:MAG: hypothetical protein A2207_03240 [Candidatus Yanofskybacteria bacterium RIFOXYA1_FULL_44_17]OGN37981.1 MAG: hypothetical protein A2405_00615 [Candidatus Yanofskybacteria bacterium RIFOXYC1_FULL_44_16]OGN39668.1 MAG: hypothetical protein A2568_03660 [Candidatus Yanofskybacteria bacterium RIFOXYD1_FULL_44_17]
MPFERDEGEYAYAAQLMRQGELPYKDSFLQKPPLIVYVYMLAQTIGGNSLWAPRVLAFIFVYISLLLIFLILRKEFSVLAGLAASWLTATTFYFISLSPFAANTEKFLILPLLGLVAVYIYFRDKNDKWPWLAAGILAAVSIMFKPIVVPIVALIFIIWLVEFVRKNSWPKSISRVGIILLGGVGTAMLIMLPIIRGGAWKYFWQEVVVFNSYYVAQYGYSLTNLFEYVKSFLLHWPFLAVLFIVFILIRPERWWFYLACLLAVLVSVYNVPFLAFGHYYIVLMPFLMMICGISFDALMSRHGGNHKTGLSIGILVSMIVVMLAPSQKLLFLSPRDLNLEIYTKHNPFVESRLVADKLAAISKPEDNVFVLGSESQIYSYSNRSSDIRFNVTFPLTLNTIKAKEYQEEVLNDLYKNNPRAIVLSLRPYSGLLGQTISEEFVKKSFSFIEKSYDLVGSYVWLDDRDGYWVDGPDTNPNDDVSLMLFVKKSL